MSITRRTFAKASLGVGTLMAAQSNMFAMENEIIKRIIPSSGEIIPVIGVGTNRYGVGNDQSARAPLKAALAKFHELGGTVIDTAPTYGSSEVVLGELISSLVYKKTYFSRARSIVAISMTILLDFMNPSNALIQKSLI